jgi:hypothetical protein
MDDYFIVLPALATLRNDDDEPKKIGFGSQAEDEKDTEFVSAGLMGFYISEVKRLWTLPEHDGILCIQFANEEFQYFNYKMTTFLRKHKLYLNLNK